MNDAKVISGPWAQSEDLILVPEGDYQVRFESHQLIGSYGGRLVLNFRILETGEFFESAIAGFYSARVIDRKRGIFTVSRHSRLAREWRLIFGRGVMRWSRIPMSALKDVLLLARVRTVTQDHALQKLSAPNQYSVVDQLLARVMP